MAVLRPRLRQRSPCSWDLLLASVVVALYVLHHGWVVAVEAGGQPKPRCDLADVTSMPPKICTPRCLAAFAGTEELAKRAIRRAGSATAVNHPVS